MFAVEEPAGVSSVPTVLCSVVSRLPPIALLLHRQGGWGKPLTLSFFRQKIGKMKASGLKLCVLSGFHGLWLDDKLKSCGQKREESSGGEDHGPAVR